ncbi:MAG: YbhB/YbcL family Raf kinase inhibitor-like protein [bacterium]|nr:YbhB/YbcL family Raf kinase inhibitor-like protein [bacterium]
MNKFLKVLIILIILGLLGWGGFWYFSKKAQKPLQQPSQKSLTFNMKIKLTSSAFENNQLIPAKYTCDGKDVNPPLRISEVPAGAQSLVLIVDDPDAPRGIWDHWIVYNINPQNTPIEENSVPEGSIQVVNSFGKKFYGGPCPPSGTHHYYFKLYALDTKLEQDISSKKELENAMENHILAQSELIGLYQRKQ